MSIRLTGMASGLDTEAMITDLMSAYKGTKQKKVNTMTKYSWKMEAWSSLNKKVNNFYSKALNNLRFSNSYNVKKASSSDSTKASVTASSEAVLGTQKLAVKQMAQSGYLTGGVLKKTEGEGKVAGDTTLREMGYAGVNTTISVKAGADGATTQIEIGMDTTISGLVKKLNDAGVNASFDANNQRIFVSAKNSGAPGDFEIVGDDVNAINALTTAGIFTGANVGSAEYETYKAWSDYNFNTLGEDGKPTDAASKAVYEAELASRVSSYKQKIVDAQDLIDKANAKKAENQAKLDDRYDEDNNLVEEGLTSKLEASEQFQTAKDTARDLYDRIQSGGELSDEEKTKYGMSGLAADSLKDITLESLTDTVLKVQANDLSKQIAETEDPDEKAELQEQLEDARAAITNYGAARAAQSAIDSANETIDSQTAIIEAAAEYVTLDDEGLGEPTARLEAETLDYLKTKVTTAQNVINSSFEGNSTAVRIYGQDAQIYLNGAFFESSKNAFEINGLTINVTGTTGLTEDAKGKDPSTLTADDYNSITLTTSNDTDAVYNNIKNFISQYNDLIKEMDKSYNADSAAKYDILTSEEKEAMSDEEVEAWEKKIRDSLLRRDESLGNLIDAMKQAMQKTYTINGQKMSLSSFGIETMSYLLAPDGEKGVFHIDGDPDDSDTAANADKLRAAIAADPEGVQEFFTSLTNDMYKSLQSKAASSVNSSYGSFYEDKYMNTQYDKYKTALADYEDKLADIEDKYYKQFSRMETALTKLQSSSSAITGLFNY